MDRLYPGLGEHLEEETIVAIDGVAQGIGWALNEEYIYDRNGPTSTTMQLP
jgi:hypothetical protein